MKQTFLALLLATAMAIPGITQGAYVQNTTTGYSMGFVSIPGGYTGGYVQGACSGGIGCVASTILYLINSVLVPLIFAIAFLVFIYGIAKTYIFSHGEPGEVAKGHQIILWGLIGFVAMVSLWGLVNVVANTFGLTGGGAPVLPTSYSQ